MARIGVLSVIHDFDSGYSIAYTTRCKLKALSNILKEDVVYIKPKNGEVPDFFKGEVREFDTLPTKDWSVEKTDELFLPNVMGIAPSFVKACEGIDILICEDVLMQGWYLCYLLAVRIAEKAHPNMKVFHNIHSCPSKKQFFEFPRDERYRLTPQEHIIYNNLTDVNRVMEMYSTRKITGLYNPVDVGRFLKLPAEIEEMFYEKEWYLNDIFCIYPTRVSAGKQHERWLTLLSGFQKYGARVMGIIVDAYGTGKKENEYKDKLRSTSEQLGIKNNRDWFFASELLPSSEISTSYEEVASLYALSNLFILSSNSETCSLIMMEAMLARNYTIVNADLDPVVVNEQGKWARKVQFSSGTRTTAFFPSFLSYAIERAGEILNEMRGNGVLCSFTDILRNHNLKVYGEDLLAVIGVREAKERPDSILLRPKQAELVLPDLKDKGIIPVDMEDVR